MEQEQEQISRRHLVRKSFLNYLKNEFPYECDWVHPTSHKLWKCSQIKEALSRIKRLNPENYKVLWALWMTRETTEFLAQRFCYSTTVIKKKWERAISTVMVLLIYPELDDEQIALYDN